MNLCPQMSTIRVDKKKADFVCFLKAQKSRFHLFFKGTKKQIFYIFLKAQKNAHRIRKNGK